MAMSAPQHAPPTALSRSGLALAIGAYLSWGLSALPVKALAHVPVVETSAHRTVWSFLCIALWIAATEGFGKVRAALASPPDRTRLMVTATMLTFNAGLFMWAVMSGRALEVSFGFFINPLIAMLLGLVLLRERLTGVQAVAMALSVIAVAVQGFSAGGLPWVSLVIATTFALYTYARKTARVEAAPGQFVEALVMLVPATAYLVWLEAAGQGHFSGDLWTAVLELTIGFIAALPMIMFVAASRRLPLVIIGLLQYISPSMHFLFAIFLFGEPFDRAKLVSFALVWAGITLFTADAVRRSSAGRPAKAQ